jgi:predicted metal-binding protein
MANPVRIGIIICDRYRLCAGGKCFRAMSKRVGAFSIYQDRQIELVGYTTCGGCPGGNIEYGPEEMVKNGAEVIHLATGFIVGYPPCPYINYFKNFITTRYDTTVIPGTHPIPQKYYEIHEKLNTWGTSEFKEIIKNTLTNEAIRLAYD